MGEIDMELTEKKKFDVLSSCTFKKVEEQVTASKNDYMTNRYEAQIKTSKTKPL